MNRSKRAILFDWGDTLMRNFPEYAGPMKNWPRVEAIPGAILALDRLHPRWTLVLATNAADSQEADIWAALERAGLKTWIDQVYCFRLIGFKKPSAAFFHAIAADLALPVGRLVMVGDDFEADVLGATACGLQAVWLNRASRETRQGSGYTTIHQLEDLESALQSLLPKPPGSGSAHRGSGNCGAVK